MAESINETANGPKDPLIIALDVPNVKQAERIVDVVGESATTFKIGKQLFTAEGPSFIRKLIDSRRRVFLDLKFHDIPNTVAGAVRAAADLGVNMLTVHASGGERMLSAAAEAADKSGTAIKVLAVTVLTSLTENDLRAIKIPGRVEDHVTRLAKLALKSGCHGVVASPKEASGLRKEFSFKPLIVTPGIRPVGSEKNDQARVATPHEAIASGASHIVVGRPITLDSNPALAARNILKDCYIGAAAQGITFSEEFRGVFVNRIKNWLSESTATAEISIPENTQQITEVAIETDFPSEIVLELGSQLYAVVRKLSIDRRNSLPFVDQQQFSLHVLSYKKTKSQTKPTRVFPMIKQKTFRNLFRESLLGCSCTDIRQSIVADMLHAYPHGEPQTPENTA